MGGGTSDLLVTPYPPPYSHKSPVSTHVLSGPVTVNPLQPEVCRTGDSTDTGTQGLPVTVLLRSDTDFLDTRVGKQLPDVSPRHRGSTG